MIVNDFGTFILNYGYWVWIGVMIICLLIEACTFSLTTIWGAMAAMVMIFISLTKMPMYWQLLIFAVITLILVFSTRPFALKKFKMGNTKTNVNTMEGQEVLVTKPISKFQKGEVKASNGVTWVAKSVDDQEISEGSICKVISVEGNTLIVINNISNNV